MMRDISFNNIQPRCGWQTFYVCYPGQVAGLITFNPYGIRKKLTNIITKGYGGEGAEFMINLPINE